MKSKPLTKADLKVLSRRLIADDQRLPTSTQHKHPCADCPWSRKALKGYTGSLTPEDWIRMVHGEDYIDCHCTTNQQCAGAAIFRANVHKLTRHPLLLRLKPNTKIVFASNEEFLKHHER